MKAFLHILFLISSIISFSQELDKDEIFPFRSRVNGKIGYINWNSEIVIEPQYASGTYFEKDGYATVSIKNDSIEKFAVIDLKGNYFISFEEGYELISLNNEIENWILVIKDGKWGYINYDKEILIPLEYDSLGDFYGNLAYAQKDGKYGFVNSSNKIVIDFEYERAGDFSSIQSDGFRYARVENENKIGYINNKGILVIPYLYDYVQPIFKGIIIAKKDKKYGCINIKGDIIVPFEFEIIYHGENIIKARKELMSNKEYYYNRQGEFIGNGTMKKR